MDKNGDKKKQPLTAEEIAEVGKFAGCFFTVEEIACVMQRETEWFKEECNRGGALRDAIKRERLIRLGKIRESILTLAEGGSSLAQEAAVRLYSDLKIDEHGAFH